MAVLIDHVPINRNPGTYQYAIATAQSGRVTIRLARKTTANPGYWDDLVEVAVVCEISLDAGVNWGGAFAITARGGIAYGYANEGDTPPELAETTVSCDVPPGVNRLRITLIVSGARLVSELTVEQE